MRPAVAFAAALLAPAAAACDGLKVSQAWIREPVPGVDVLAGYAELENAGRHALEVDGVEVAGFGHAMIHQTVVKDGVSRMRHATVALPPGGKASLEPGGLHIMLMQPARPLRAGDRLEGALLCGPARTAVTFTVKTPQAR